MKNSKNLFRLMAIMVVALSVTVMSSCSDDNDPKTKENVLSGTIAADMTLEASKTYTLQGNVFVASGVTLTIEPGTVIFGDKVSKGALVVERGATINAAGTADKPIVFTSSAPVNYRNYGDWGGVVLLGNASNNQGTSVSIEGITAGDNSKYGGTKDDDNSGVLTYVRIEFAGIELTTDNELNGLTMGSVGSGTTINHIQVSYSGDDSYEWFGGAVNAQYLVAYRGWDDDFDTDFGFHGNVQYCVSFRDPNIADKSVSNGFESDNDGNGTEANPRTSAKFSNVTWFGPHASSALSSNKLKAGNASSNYGVGAHIRRRSDLQIYNTVFVGSHFQGVLFDKTGANAVFKGNYFARCGVNVSKSLISVIEGNGYDASGFEADNYFEEDQATVDLSATFAGLTGAMDLSSPSAMLAGSSSLLTGAVEVPEGLTQTTYIGAFDASNNWLNGWTNFSPNATAY